MSITLTPEDQNRAERLVSSGRFTNVEEVVQAGLEVLEDNDNWQRYAHDRIKQGLDDIAAGRTISGDQFLKLLDKGRLRQA